MQDSKNDATDSSKLAGLFLQMGIRWSHNGLVLAFACLHGHLEGLLHQSRIKCSSGNTSLDGTLRDLLGNLGSLLCGLSHELSGLGDSSSSHLDGFLYQRAGAPFSTYFDDSPSFSKGIVRLGLAIVSQDKSCPLCHKARDTTR